MHSLVKIALLLNNDKHGVTALEYGLIAAVVSGVVATTFTGIGTHLKTVLNTVNNAI